MADYATQTLTGCRADPQVWAVGARVHARLTDAGLPLLGLFTVPNSVQAITPLVGQILVEHETHHDRGEVTELHLFYNRPTSGSVSIRLGINQYVEMHRPGSTAPTNKNHELNLPFHLCPPAKASEAS